ncbi:MAG: class I SAM-dependent methyltransferase [Flavobacteriales bacterium]|nr:class I SAM-dependent methyltransferase [Flavobacteriales bacterium]MCB9449135.1 class I SAM-dependent methyltransferase [Flavobacteriales bacterium]
MFQFIENVLANNEQYYAFREIEEARRRLKYDNRKIKVTDFGAGSTGGMGPERAVHQILTHSAMPARWGRLLFRMSNYFAPSTILELGTSLGMGTSYLAKGNPGARVITLEGCKQTAAIARENLHALNLDNVVEVVTGEFDAGLPIALKNLRTLDMVFIDGNHRYEPTLAYFKACLPYAHEKTVFLFHDIHWSAEMEKAWEEVCKYPGVTVSIDLFHLGVVFMKRDQAQQHFVLKYA